MTFLYTSNTCGYCINAKKWLQEHGISFSEKNISKERAYLEELLDRGVRSVPFLVYDGGTIIGFDKRIWKKELIRKKDE